MRVRMNSAACVASDASHLSVLNLLKCQRAEEDPRSPRPCPPSQTHCSPGTGAAASQAWIIQQLCTRGTLSHALEHGGLNAYDNTPDVKLILELAAEVASALKYLHSKSMLHGDLNASNVMLHDDPHLTRGFKAMVTDFGLVRMCRASRNTASLGTVSHM